MAGKERKTSPIRVLFVCLGNICRSPMAEALFQHYVQQEGLDAHIVADSCGTGNWHVGEPPCPGTRRVLARHGISYRGRARQITREDIREADYVIAMDRDNVADLLWLDKDGHLDGKLHLLMEFAPEGSPEEVPDPYYEGNFEYVFSLVKPAVRGLLTHIKREDLGIEDETGGAS